MKIRFDRMLRMKGSAEHSRCTSVDRPSRSADEQLHNNAPDRKCLRKKTTACVSRLVFFTIKRGTFPYSTEDDASTTSQTPTTHYTNTCVKGAVYIVWLFICICMSLRVFLFAKKMKFLRAGFIVFSRSSLGTSILCASTHWSN